MLDISVEELAQVKHELELVVFYLGQAALTVDYYRDLKIKDIITELKDKTREALLVVNDTAEEVKHVNNS